jgi:hypothetical protein
LPLGKIWCAIALATAGLACHFFKRQILIEKLSEDCLAKFAKPVGLDKRNLDPVKPKNLLNQKL